jgi:hypothetical protein
VVKPNQGFFVSAFVGIPLLRFETALERKIAASSDSLNQPKFSPT